MGCAPSKTKSKRESPRPTTDQRLNPAWDAAPFRNGAAAGAKTTYKSMTTFQVQRERTQVSSSVTRTSTTTTKQSGVLGGTAAARYSPVFRKTSLTPPSTSTNTPGMLGGTPAFRYEPVYKRPSLTSPPDSLPNERSLPIGSTFSSSASDKYDLSKNAYVLVLHHYEFKEKANNRPGSMKDMKKIEKVLKSYRTDTIKTHNNCSLDSVRWVMKDVAVKDFSKHSCLIVFIMSHGNAQDTIMSYEGRLYSFQEDIVEKCTSNVTLKGKPKIFVLQACRGNAFMQTDSAKKIISEKFDIVTFQSTYEGTVSFRDPINGTFFMQEFLNMLEKHDRVDIKEINTHLNQLFNENRISQTPTITSTLGKRLIFGDLRKA